MSSIIIKETAKRIRDVRKEKGLSGDDVARACNMHRATYFRYESGDQKNMKLDKIQMIAEALDVHPAELIVWDDEKPASDESGLDDELMQRLTSLTPGELAMVDAYVQGILAARSKIVSPCEKEKK